MEEDATDEPLAQSPETLPEFPSRCILLVQHSIYHHSPIFRIHLPVPTDQALMFSSAARNQTLLITIGSTLFPSLTDLALSPPFLNRLLQLGVKELIVQYGRADLTFPPGSRSTAGKDGSAVFIWTGAAGGAERREGPLRVKVLRYTDDFEGLVRSAQWVISHAGSGSILTVLRTPRPLLVVPNTDLMDNHQAQLADALGGEAGGGEEGYLLVSIVEELIDNVHRLLEEAYNPKPFPPVDHTRFRTILDQTAGFAP